MTKTMLSRFTGAVALGALTTAASLPAYAAMNSSGEVSPWVAHAEKAGPVADSKRIEISVYLGLRNEKALDELLKAQATPGSAQYGRYLTRAQFHERFAPEKSSVDAVKAALKSQGLTSAARRQAAFMSKPPARLAKSRRHSESTRITIAIRARCCAPMQRLQVCHPR